MEILHHDDIVMLKSKGRIRASTVSPREVLAIKWDLCDEMASCNEEYRVLSFFLVFDCWSHSLAAFSSAVVKLPRIFLWRCSQLRNVLLLEEKNYQYYVFIHGIWLSYRLLPYIIDTIAGSICDCFWFLSFALDTANQFWKQAVFERSGLHHCLLLHDINTSLDLLRCRGYELIIVALTAEISRSAESADVHWTTEWVVRKDAAVRGAGQLIRVGS